MRRRVATVVAAAGLALAPAATAGADTGRTTFWPSCEGGGPVQNTATPSWTRTPPTASVTTGAGCGALDSPVRDSRDTTPLDGVLGGRFGGAFAAVEAELHDVGLWTPKDLMWGPDLFVRLTVDGRVVVPETKVRVTAVPSPSGVSHAVRLRLEGLDVPGGQDDRPVRLTVASWGALWAWGAAEVPSHVTFVAPPLPGADPDELP